MTQTGTAESAPAWSVLNFRVYAAGARQRADALVDYGGDEGNGFNTKDRRVTETHEGPVAPREARAASDEGAAESKHPLNSPVL